MISKARRARILDSLNEQKNKHRGWRIPSKVAGPLNLVFFPMRSAGLDSFERTAICHTLRLIQRYGALGSKTSHGQGVINVNDWCILLTRRNGCPCMARNGEETSIENGTNPTPSPDLRDFIGVIISLDTEVTTKTNWWNVPLDGLNSFSLGTDHMDSIGSSSPGASANLVAVAR